MITEFNTVIIQYLNWLITNNTIQNLVFLFADLPIFLLPVFLVITWLFIRFKKDNNLGLKQDLVLIVIWIVLALIINLILQIFIKVDRPETALNSAKFLLEHLPDWSFPSDHASVSIAFLTGLFLSWYNRIAKVFLVLSIMMLVFRIAWWVHWPTDIIAWSIIWLISAKLVFYYRDACLIKIILALAIWLASLIKL